MTNIYGYSLGSGFGDLWVFANNLAMLSQELSEIKYNPITKIASEEQYRPRYLGTITEALNALNFNGIGKITPVYDTPTIYYWRYKNQYVKTKVKYTGESNYIVYQEDAVSDKPSESELKIFFKCLDIYSKKYEFIRLGKDKTVAECVEIASKAKAFIGFNSGMTQLCLSVGTPIYLTHLSWYFQGLTYGMNIVPSIEEMFKKACNRCIPR